MAITKPLSAGGTKEGGKNHQMEKSITDRDDDGDDYSQRQKLRNVIGGLPDDSKPPDAKPTKAEPLKGYYFHSVKNGDLHWQGVILSQWQDYVLVLTWEWLMGQISASYMIKVSDLVWNQETKTGYLLYSNHFEFDRSYTEGMAHSLQARSIAKARESATK